MIKEFKQTYLIGDYNEITNLFKVWGFEGNYFKGIHYNADIFGCEVHADFTDKSNLFTLNVKIGELHTVKQYLTGDENDVMEYIQKFINDNRDEFVKVRAAKQTHSMPAEFWSGKKK